MARYIIEIKDREFIAGLKYIAPGTSEVYVQEFELQIPDEADEKEFAKNMILTKSKREIRSIKSQIVQISRFTPYREKAVYYDEERGSTLVKLLKKFHTPSVKSELISSDLTILT